MSPRSSIERMQDILDAIIEIQGFVVDIGFTEFQNDLKTLRAVELVHTYFLVSYSSRIVQIGNWIAYLYNL